jgi:hypothetical protein
MGATGISNPSVGSARSSSESVFRPWELSWIGELLFASPLLLMPYTTQLQSWIGIVDMAVRDYEAAPVAESLGLIKIIHGLAGDLDALRGGKITVQDAIARSLLAKQIFNGVRIYLNGTKLLSEQARNCPTIATPDRKEP